MLEGVYKGCTPLFIAVAHSNIIGVKWLVDNGVNPEAPLHDGPDKGYTPIYAAARNYNLEIIKYLVSKGVNLEAKLPAGNSNNTLLSLIISNKWTFLHFNENPCNVLGKKSEIIKLLLINGAEINNINIEAITEPNIKDLLSITKAIKNLVQLKSFNELEAFLLSKDIDKPQSQEIITEQELARTSNHEFAIKLFKNLLIKTGIPGDYTSYNKLLEQKYSGKISDDLLKKLKNTITEGEGLYNKDLDDLEGQLLQWYKEHKS